MNTFVLFLAMELFLGIECDLSSRQQTESEDNEGKAVTTGPNYAGCEDNGLPVAFTEKKACRELKLSCSKLFCKCNMKLKSSLGKSKKARRCKEKLSPKEGNSFVKSFCNKSCKECCT